MSKEDRQILYRDVDLVTPREAGKFGVVVDKPTFISRTTYPHSPETTIYEFGAIAEGSPIIAYPNLKTALVVGGGFEVTYTGFIAVGEAIGGEYVTEHIGRYTDQYAKVEKMRIIGFKAFVEEQEIKYGHVKEFNHPYNQGSSLVIDRGNGRDQGRNRFAFRVTFDGNVLFQEFGKRVVTKQEEEPLNYQQILDAVARGKVVRITRPLFGITHGLTRPNQMGGYISLEKLTKEQIMDMYQNLYKGDVV